MKTQIKTDEEIMHMRQSGKILHDILVILTREAKPGVTTKRLDDIAASELKKHSAKAAFLGYNGFPASICISVNEEIVHGIPKERELIDGDIVGLDFGVNYKGMITDSAVTIGIGKISRDQQRLLDYTKKALYSAIDVLKDGVRVGDIGEAVDKQLRAGNLKVIRNLGGHGVGHQVHEDPIILNFGHSGTGETLRAGMTIAIEPIASISTHDTYLADDGWTYVTSDGSMSAQFEHTILITRSGAEILTA
ncbi:MAG: methionyl aminopeptidase [Patescibacteria group bacterium]|jgi:methionyl aminopeptidase|nr:methionyl aminopeptidase [Patescibacteria group bacterium]